MFLMILLGGQSLVSILILYLYIKSLIKSESDKSEKIYLLFPR